MKLSQTQHANALIRALRVLDERAKEIERTVDQTGLEWVPPGGGWSVGQILEHLCVANDDYLRELRSIIGEAHTPSATATTDLMWRSSFAGGILARSMQSPRKLPAPKSWTPGPTPRPHVMDAFLSRQREIVQLIERSRAREWNRMRLASPVAWFIRMNVGDAFTILVWHAERHFRQIDERLAAFDAAHGGDRVTATR